MRYLQRAASTPATRLEVVALQERLDRALQERQVLRQLGRAGWMTDCVKQRACIRARNIRFKSAGCSGLVCAWMGNLPCRAAGMCQTRKHASKEHQRL